MSFFGIKSDKKSEKELRSNFVLICLLVLAFIFVLLMSSAAWFARNDGTTAAGMEVAVATDLYDLIVEHDGEYDTGYDGITGANGLKSTLAADGYSLTQTNTSNAPKLMFELTNEFIYDGHKYLMPGAYGSLTFYLRPKNTGDLTVNFNLSRAGYTTVTDEFDNVTVEQVTKPNALNMLEGHLLFFTGRTGANYENYVYTGLIQDDTFTYDTSLHTKSTRPGYTDCYEITLYWEWPVTYYEIYDETGTAEPAVTKKYPAELRTYIDTHRQNYFTVNQSSNVVEELSDGYDDGDQTIGDNIKFVTVFIS